MMRTMWVGGGRSEKMNEVKLDQVLVKLNASEAQVRTLLPPTRVLTVQLSI